MATCHGHPWTWFPAKKDWHLFAVNRNIRADTNYPYEVVDKVFHENWLHFPRRDNEIWKIQAAFYMVLMFINLYPYLDQVERMLSIHHPAVRVRCTKSFFKTWVVPIMVQLGTHINYIDYGRRWCLFNHVPLIPDR